MAEEYSNINLDDIKNFMIQNGGRVTNHDLVQRFRPLLTNSTNGEHARHQFKKYVNTLSSMSNESGEKYLILKRKYRIGTSLEVEEYPDPGPDSHPQFPIAPHNSALYPYQAQSPTIPPPYRAPPPYRPPPEPSQSPSSGLAQQYSHFQNNSPILSHSSSSVHSSPSILYSNSHERLQDCHQAEEPRRMSMQEPNDLGIPPPPMWRQSSLASSPADVTQSSYSSSKLAEELYMGARPHSLSNIVGLNEGKGTPCEMDYSRNESSLLSTSRGSLISSASAASLEDVMSGPAVPPRRRHENKENRKPATDDKISLGDDSCNSSRRSSVAAPEDNGKISVRETTQKFNKMASEVILSHGRSSNKTGRGGRNDRDDDETPVLSSFGPDGLDWAVAAAKADFNEMLRLLKIYPILAKYRDTGNGYGALHWAAKHGRSEVIKLLCGTYQLNINSRSNGGYTPLHLSAIYNRHDTFDLLTHYGADLNLRDYSGKKPRQYQTTTASTISQDTQKRIIRRRNSMKESSGFLRIGSLNVKVRKTTEALNSLISRDVEARLHRSWGSSDSLPESEKDSKHMPPPKFNLKKRKNKKDKDRDTPKSTPSTTPAVTPTPTRSDRILIQRLSSSIEYDSDNACGFGNEWH